MTVTVGALFAGYGGLEMGLADVLNTRTAWYAEYEKAPAAIMARHHPDAPNLWDVTKVDWTDVEPVDVITGGSPCQDLSHAGKRAGMKAGTRSGLWASMCDAIDTIRPRLVLWENVRGAYSAPADSAVEPCPICVGDGRGTYLRALGRVLGDLAELGYDARWYGLRAADVGAAHGRFRVFVIAAPAADAVGGGRDGRALDALRGPVGGTAAARGGEVAGADLTLLPTPVADNSRGLPSASTDYASLANVACELLPTPAVNDMGAAYTPETWDAWTERMKAAHGNGNGHGKSLAIEAQRLLPTPRTANNENRQSEGYGGESGNYYGLIHGGQDWQQYDAAIRRAETATGRPAPPPTEVGPKGSPRLSARFVEWLMMLPAGHVTDTPGLTRNDQLKALGNGVVPPQAAAAIRAYIADETREGAA